MTFCPAEGVQVRSLLRVESMRTCILVADRARARFFVLEAPPEHRPGDPARLRELESLVDPEGELTGKELFTDSHSGTNHAGSGASYEYDDHRERHRREIERRFAKRVALATAEFARNHGAQKLVLAAEPQMLGMLRPVLPSALPNGVTLVELARDLSWHTPERIQSALAQHGALAANHHA
jgi:protein required for attachment to host cells